MTPSDLSGILDNGWAKRSDRDMAEGHMRDCPMTGLRPKSASAPKLATQLYGTIPAFPSWAQMKQDEKGNTARPRNSASRQRKTMVLSIDEDDSGEVSILAGTAFSSKESSRPASPGSVLSRPTTATPERDTLRRASVHSHQRQSHQGDPLSMAQLRPQSAIDIYSRKFRLRPRSAIEKRPATAQGLSGEATRQVSHSMSILEKEEIVFRGGMRSPAVKGLVETQDLLRKSGEQRRIAKVRLIMSTEKQRLHSLKELEAQRARQAEQDHWKREVLSEMLEHVGQMEAQEEEETRRQEAAHLHAPAARLPKAAASKSLSFALGFTTRLIHKTERP